MRQLPEPQVGATTSAVTRLAVVFGRAREREDTWLHCVLLSGRSG